MDDRISEAGSYKDLYLIAVEGLEKANLEIDRLKALAFTAAEYLEMQDLPEGLGFATYVRRVVTQDFGPDGLGWTVP